MHLVPVAESRRYRKRAQAAEQSVASLEAALREKDDQLQRQQNELAELQRSQRIDAALIDADAIDLDTARLLAERMLAEKGETEDAECVEKVVAKLRGRKPFLFRDGARASGVMSPRVEARRVTETERAAGEAHNSGSRTDLLRYLRLKRKT